MNREELIDALGMLDDDMLQETEVLRQKTEKGFGSDGRHWRPV